MSGEPLISKTCKRYNTPWDAHELTFSCYGRKAFLGRDRAREYLVEAVNKARHRHPFHVWAYVIMPEHVHLLVWPTAKSYDVSAILYAIKYPVGRRALDYLRKNNPAGLRHLATGQKHVPYRFWLDGGGFDRNVRADRAVRNMADYMHANPVRRELAKQAEDWLWSSYKDWEELGTGPIPIDRESLEWAHA
jgi:putative transposase